jgi:cyclopropane fatty-acyl-phospholipid synthase-like methyltransferase
MKLLDAFKQKKFGVLTKDKHYFDVYDFWLEKRQNDIKKVLEIGICGGGSLALWKEYFINAEIVGVDIDGSCKQFETDGVKVYIGSQNDRLFLNDVINIEKEFDLIIDDGSHEYFDQMVSFETLFSCLKHDGLYVIEDLGTSYFSSYGYGSKDSFVDYLKNLIDDVNYAAINYDDPTANYPNKHIFDIHFYNSICIIHKLCVEQKVFDQIKG